MKRNEKIEYYISLFLRASMGSLIFVGIYHDNYFLVFASSFFLFLTFLPAILRRRLNVNLPIGMDLIIAIILYAHFFLGMYNGFYSNVWWWDIFLHSGNSAILGLAGFTFAYALTITNTIKAKPLLVSIFAISFAISIGVFWEIFEFASDNIFGSHMQASGLVDTMTDLIADTLGALVIGAVGYLYLRNPHPGWFEKAVQWSTKINNKS